MKTTGTCTQCRSASSKSDTWNAIGENVVCETAMGRGYAQTEYRFFQCAQCGSVFVEYEDSGAGGRGKFIQHLTKRLY